MRDDDGRRRDERRRMLVSTILADFRRFDSRPASRAGAPAAVGDGSRPAT